MKEIDFYLIRHGETQWNVLELMQGSKDSPLTDNGIEGAKITGKFLADTPFVSAYSSTQKRAQDTRDYILAEHNQKELVIPRFEHPGFCEMDFGIWEGQKVADLRQSPEFQPYLLHPGDFDSSVNQGEDYLDVLARMKQGLLDIAEKQGSGNVLIVSHGSAIRLLLHVINGGDWKQHRDESISPRILNTSISIVNYKQPNAEKEGIFSLKQYNDVNHLA